MPEETFHVRFTEAQTAFVRLEPSCFPWRLVTEALPENGAWCWVWHTQWGTEHLPFLGCFRAAVRGTQWWTVKGVLRLDQVTHWMPVQVPEPPPAEERGYALAPSVP